MRKTEVVYGERIEGTSRSERARRELRRTDYFPVMMHGGAEMPEPLAILVIPSVLFAKNKKLMTNS